MLASPWIPPSGPLAFWGSQVLALLLLVMTAWVAGRLATRRLDIGTGWEGFAIPAALGLVILAHILLLLGLLGLLSRGSVLGVVGVVCLLGLLGPHPRPLSHPHSRPPGEGSPRPKNLWQRFFPPLLGERECGWERGARGVRAFGLGLLVVVVPLVVLALYPPTAFDETLYHLPYARAFARTGGVPFLPELRNPVFPQVNELLFTAMLLLAGDVAPHLVELLAVLATAALLVGWGRRLGSPAAGWLAGGLWLGNPIVVHLSGTGYIEPGLALFATAAVWAVDRWRGSGERVWLVLAGAFAGSAAGTKYFGLYFVGAIFLAIALATPPRGRRVRDLLVYSLATLAVLAPWYGRILFYTGNPIFPFYSDLLGLAPTPWGPPSWPSESYRTFWMRLKALLALPWNVVFARRGVGFQPPYSPAYLLGLPLLIAALFRDARVRWILALGAGYALIFMLLPPDARYLVAVLPLASLALGLSAARWVAPRPAAALAAVLLLPGWSYAVYRIAIQGPPPATIEARDRYLAEQLPVYPALRFLNGTRRSGYTVYALHAENMVYHADGVLLGDWVGPASFGRILPLVHDPAALHRELRRLGAGYLLVVQGVGIPPPVDDPAFRTLFRRVYSDGASEVFELKPGTSRR